MEEKKFCCNCRYMPIEYNKEPCKSCREKSNFQVRLKAGDLVISKNDYMSVKAIYIYLGNNWVLHVPDYVLVRSECDYTISNYIDKLIDDNIALHIYNLDLVYANPKDITAHDCRANTVYVAETLNKWFCKLLKEKPVSVQDLHGESYPWVGGEWKNKLHMTKNDRYDIKKVIFRDPATIIFWEDGTKTVVKTQDGEKYDKEKGFAMAVCKKVFGNERDYYNVFKRWMRKGKEVANEQG